MNGAGRSNRFVCAAVALACTALTAASSQATLLVYEGFDYGVANNATMNGVASTATGTTGNWTVTNVFTTSGVATSTYQTTGLSFGSNFATTAGAIRLQTTFQATNAQTTATVQLNVATPDVGSTVWNSYLVNYTSISNANGGFAHQGIAGTATGGGYLIAGQSSDATSANRKFLTSYDTTLPTGSNTGQATNTVYFVLSRFTNVGATLSAGSPGVATAWLMTEAQYASWQADGATEALLNGAPLTYYTQRVTDTVNSGSSVLDSSKFMFLQNDAPNFNGNSETALYDEIRWGTALEDVAPAVPEPTSLAVLALGAGVTLMRRRNGSV